MDDSKQTSEMGHGDRSSQLTRALDLWVELTGVDPDQKSFRCSMGGGVDEFTIHLMNEDIKEALELDPTTITAHLLLGAFTDAYFKQRTFSVDELLVNPQRVGEYAAKAHNLKALVLSPEISDVGDRFAEGLLAAARQYQAATDDVVELLGNRHKLAYLRRDALRSIKQLRVDQFLKGRPEPEGVRPAYNGIVHRFWNINSLISTAVRQPSGVTLNLVRSPDAFQSYFAFAIRNGGNLFVLSDVPQDAHPLQKYLSRRPDRDFDRRASRNWFPYDLLNLKYDEESESLYLDTSSQTSLIPLQQEVDRLKPLGELDAAEIVWLIMMFDLIQERFWHAGHQAPELSYTGQMVREETPLIDAANRALIPVEGYKTLSLPPLTVDSIRTERVSEEEVGSLAGSPHAWMEERYATRVNDGVINLLGGPDNNYFLPPFEEGRSRPSEPSQYAVAHAGGVLSIAGHKDNQPFWDKEGRYELYAFDPASFGTSKEVAGNRIFLARHNLAKSIQRLADQEYEQRKDEIKKWWDDAVKARIDRIYSMTTAGESWREIDAERFPCAEISVSGWWRNGKYPLVKRWTAEECSKHFVSLGLNGVALTQGYRSRGDTFLCHVTGAPYAYNVVFQPQTAADISYILDCEVTDLPDVIQHWCRKVCTHGNSLLDRVDPMAWALHNPWSELTFSIQLFLSKRGLTSILKRYNAPADLVPGDPSEDGAGD